MWKREFVILSLLFGVAYCYPQLRVINGTDSDITRYPFMASLRNSSARHICGCSIIAPRWALTAAHCVEKYEVQDLSVQYGLTDISALGPNIVSIKSFYMHEGYDRRKNFANDIALLELSDTLVFNNKTVAPVTLPEQNYETPQVAEGAPGVLIGWGRTATHGSSPRTLQEVTLKIYSDEECQNHHNGNVTTNNICGGVDEGGKGQCSGDSGGPLSQILPSGLVQVGIVSWSIKPCAVYPGVYTKVSHYIDWIQDIMNYGK